MADRPLFQNAGAVPQPKPDNTRNRPSWSQPTTLANDDCLGLARLSHRASCTVNTQDERFPQIIHRELTYSVSKLNADALFFVNDGGVLTAFGRVRMRRPNPDALVLAGDL